MKILNLQRVDDRLHRLGVVGCRVGGYSGISLVLVQVVTANYVRLAATLNCARAPRSTASVLAHSISAYTRIKHEQGLHVKEPDTLSLRLNLDTQQNVNGASREEKSCAYLFKFRHGNGLLLALELHQTRRVQVEIETGVRGREGVAHHGLLRIAVIERKGRSGDGGRHESKESKELHDWRRGGVDARVTTSRGRR